MFKTSTDDSLMETFAAYPFTANISAISIELFQRLLLVLFIKEILPRSFFRIDRFSLKCNDQLKRRN